MSAQKPINTTKKEGGVHLPSFSLEEMQKRQELNDKITHDDVARSHTLAWIIIGGIALIVGLAFLYISFKYDSTGNKSFRPKSMEFIVSCISLSFGLFGVIYGAVRTILLSLRIRKAKRELQAF